MEHDEQEDGADTVANEKYPEAGKSVAAKKKAPAKPTAKRANNSAVLAAADRVLARAHDQAPAALRAASDPLAADTGAVMRESARSRDAVNNPVTRNYANDAYIDEMVDGGDQVLDLMTGAGAPLYVREEAEMAKGFFREFERGSEVEVMVGGVPTRMSEGQLAYEAFMHEPLVILVHESKDKNDPPACYVGVNGDERWLPRGKKVRVPRKLVERLAQAQERTFQTYEVNDPTTDSMMKTVQRSAASYSFSVLHDPSRYGRRWLQRVTRDGT